MESYIAVDVETTGLNPRHDRLLEIAAVKVQGFQIIDVFTTLINPGIKIPARITQITGISDAMAGDGPSIEEVIEEFTVFCGDEMLLGHNLLFDYGFLKQNCMQNKLCFEKNGIDTLKIARKMLAHLESRSLDRLCSHFKINLENHHRALADAQVTSELYQKFHTLYSGEYQDLFVPEKLMFKAKEQPPITQKQKSYLTALLKHHNLYRGRESQGEVEKLTKNQASRMIDKIILNYGRIY